MAPQSASSAPAAENASRNNAHAAPLMLSVSGCRGILGASLTPDVISRFAGTFATWLASRQPTGAGRPTVVLGRDGRRGGELVRDAAVAGLLGAGCDVVDLGVASTPTVAVLTDYTRAQITAEYSLKTESGLGAPAVAGMVLTASHNPQEWNGLKCLLAEESLHGSSACAPPARLANEVIDRFRGAGPTWAAWNQAGAFSYLADGPELHVQRVLDAMRDAGFIDDPEELGRGLSVSLDSVNGSGAVAGRLLLEGLGCEEILHMGMEETGIFSHTPEPTAENLAVPGGLCETVPEAESDVGFAQDPDADRLAMVDATGRYIGEEYTLALSAMALLENEKLRGRSTQGLLLATNLSTSRMLDDVAARYGASVLRTPVGEANVVAAMKERRCICGGEGNGGIIWPRVAFVRDSLCGMALALWLLSPAGAGRGQKQSIAELVASLPSYAIRKRKVDLPRREDAAPAIEKIAAAHGAQHVDRSDGAWVDFRQGPLAGKAWLHVRASNTEPIMRLIAEAPSAAEADAILDQAARIIG